MSAPLRISPVYEALAVLDPQWQTSREMLVASRLAGDESVLLQTAALADLSCLDRIGLKGPAAVQWLQTLGVEVPARPNAWCALPGGGVIARLGRTEFFLEDGLRGDTVERVRAALGTGVEDVVPVIRQDAGLALTGYRVNEVLLQVCSVNFEALVPQDRIAFMTLMVGVGVLVIRNDYKKDVPCYRIWCDPTFAMYLWETLAGITGELGGGVIGAEGLLADTGKVAGNH